MNPRLDSLLRDTVTAAQANVLTPLYALPAVVRRRIAGAPIQIDGNTLDPDVQLLLRLDNLLPRTTKTDAATARAHFRALCRLIPGRPAEVQRVTDLTVRGATGQLGARLYVPRPTPPAADPSTPPGAGDLGTAAGAGDLGTAAAAGDRSGARLVEPGPTGTPPSRRSTTPDTGDRSTASGTDDTGTTPGSAELSTASGSAELSTASGSAELSTASGSADASTSPGAGGSGRRATSLGGLLVFFHGGGWVVGDLDTHDALCRAIAADAGIRVLSVDYRLAPEAPAPTAAEDAIAAFTWAADHAEDLGADPALVAVGGDSAGGNLAAVVAQQTALRGLPQPALQVLLYPGLDLVARRPSRDLFSEGFILTEEDIIWYRDMYTPDPTLRPDPIVSPLRAPDLRNLPPTYLSTAGFDPLRDEGLEYAKALTEAGNALTHIHHPTLPHGHANLLTVPGTTRDALNHLTNHLKTTLH